MSAAIPLPLLVRHEVRLAWRDLVAMLTAGRARRLPGVIAGVVVVAGLLHLPAIAMVGQYAEMPAFPGSTAMLVISACIGMAAALMLSQAIESVTRAFYTRADLDLIMSSPSRMSDVFAIRMATIAVAITVMALVLFSPFIDVLVIKGGPRWFAAFGVIVSLGLFATAMSIGLTAALFHLCGPRRTRLVAQVLAAVIGAAFIIALQVAGIMSYGTMSRFAVLTSDAAAAAAPAAASLAWWPARALLGDASALATLLAIACFSLGMAIALSSRGFAGLVAQASTAVTSTSGKANTRPPRALTRHRALWWKEWLLLRRDPWLMSQTLMQLLYLVPPALFLWRSFGDRSGAAALITPVIVMAAGQLSGGLAWLTISGEDARDLVATAPLLPARIMRAKIEIVLMIIAVVFAPLVLPLLWSSPAQAGIAALGVALAGASATAIQLWFRSDARRSQFRRRQTASRFATFAEAFASIGWAATAAMALAAPVLAAVSAFITLTVLTVAWRVGPSGRTR